MLMVLHWGAIKVPSHHAIMPSRTVYSYLQISDSMGERKVYLKEARYLIGGSGDCDIRLTAPTSDECRVLFVRVRNGYQVRDIDLQNSSGIRPYESYTLKDGDRIIFAPLAQAIYCYTTEPPDESGGLPALLPPPPTSFPPAEAVAPMRARH